MLDKLVGLVVTLAIAAMAVESGKDLISSVVRLSQVTTERLTLGQIGKSVQLENSRLGRRLTSRELPDFLRKQLQSGARDSATDIWGTFYALEIVGWKNFVFPQSGEQFVVWSAGPDKKWRTPDDEVWMNFPDPSPGKAFSSTTPHGEMAVEAMFARVQDVLDKVKDKLGMEKTPRTRWRPATQPSVAK